MTGTRRNKATGIAALVMLAAGPAGKAAQAATLVKHGRAACAVIVTDELRAKISGDYAVTRKHGTYVEIALEELKEHLSLAAQGEIETLDAKAAEAGRVAREQTDAGRAVVLLGGPELDTDLAWAIRQAHRDASEPDPESFALQVADGS